ncbi:MAG TPA: zf-HC2 domain-containing protein [Ktedonobacterales bacterium]|nr:zf-HC2 domain-containing protein [Ktedonobacterales bacterium]HEX5572476.1 zf-HC2 domain-containing protein [Ktedonobacterales bacterium]
MTCHQARQQLAAYRRDDWTAAELRQLAGHLESCAECRQIEATYRQVGESIRQLPSIIPDASFRESVFAAIAAEREKLGPAAMLASRAETQPALPVVRAPITPIRRRTPTPVMRAAVAIAAVLAFALFVAQFLPSLNMGGVAANFFSASHLSPAPTATQPSGVVAHPGQGPFASDEFSSTTLYRGWVGSTWVNVYAGEAWTNAAAKQGQGALRVYDSQMKLIGVYTAPGATKWLKINGAHGSVLSLTSDTGAALTFDLTTNTFSV